MIGKKGFTPHLFCNLKRFLTTKCRFESPKGAGFSFIELMVATIILAIAVAGVYAAFLSSNRFTRFFRHDIMAVILADSLLQQVRAGYKYYDPDVVNPPSMVNVVDDDNPPDISGLGAQLNSEVNNLAAADETVTEENYGTPAYGFKRVDVTVTRDER